MYRTMFYMLALQNNVLYVGVTSDLKRRSAEHKEGSGSAFTDQAITREKQLKHFKREWKNALVDEVNPEWKDLYEGMVMNPMIV